MSIHIAAKAGEIAETVLMPGDPLRAQYIADNYLKDVVCYNKIRGMFGFTGTYKGKKLSIQGSGMGIPSFSIYATELITHYNVKRIFRIGSCGSLQDSVKIRDIVIATSACTDSSIHLQTFNGMTFAPTASFSLLYKAFQIAQKEKINNVKVGSIVSTDIFYDEHETWKLWSKYGILAVEMEAAALYTLAARYHIESLAIVTVSDHLITHEACSAEEREKNFNSMVELALETAIS